MPVLSLACHLPHNTPHIPSRYNNEQTTKQTKAINNSYIYKYIFMFLMKKLARKCECDTNRAGHFTLDAYASRPVARMLLYHVWLGGYLIQFEYWLTWSTEWVDPNTVRWHHNTINFLQNSLKRYPIGQVSVINMWLKCVIKNVTKMCK